ncbi:hypothetical protein M378DRAFT_571247 [Amanita muscaria Koide BX008]|uniref:Uncharacterized protein n=1 Tax=Amanita muscaria (strain Koide BX008) TaxID=946122 RepID=A0A0C2TD09_AMAMK|nr:hypothetical protein M378DRAFT_571247 [Amanita muscaria Koide BX008]
MYFLYQCINNDSEHKSFLLDCHYFLDGNHILNQCLMLINIYSQYSREGDKCSAIGAGTRSETLVNETGLFSEI